MGAISYSSVGQFWADLFEILEQVKRDYANVFRDYEYYVARPDRLIPNARRARECPDWALLSFQGIQGEGEGTVVGALSCPQGSVFDPLEESFIRIELRFTRN